ncbi:hypothetical protein Acr_00g0038260 [Actinidia rufa]|uniref:Uncharacterized protein n=1 Tax=Actinidia rufa TaxID=165716 RepID=A0A7J0DH85_9ERIC|nr:hypothetical protein Acr_00g0038260 [Actinidia rufa]
MAFARTVPMFGSVCTELRCRGPPSLLYNDSWVDACRGHSERYCRGPPPAPRDCLAWTRGWVTATFSYLVGFGKRLPARDPTRLLGYVLASFPPLHIPYWGLFAFLLPLLLIKALREFLGRENASPSFVASPSFRVPATVLQLSCS